MMEDDDINQKFIDQCSMKCLDSDDHLMCEMINWCARLGKKYTEHIKDLQERLTSDQ